MTTSPGEIFRLSVSNTTGSPIEMHAIRVVKSGKGDIVQLNGPASADRVLSDGYNEEFRCD